MNTPLKCLGHFESLTDEPEAVQGGAPVDLGNILAFNRSESTTFYLHILHADDDTLHFPLPIPSDHSGIILQVADCVVCPRGAKLAVSDSPSEISGDPGANVDVVAFGRLVST